jgi:hypothetical protein
MEIHKIVKIVNEPNRNKTECHEFELNLSKDKAMHKGENPSLLDE